MNDINEQQEMVNPRDDKFHVTDEGSADWVVAKITAYEDEKKRVNAMHEAKIKEIDSNINTIKYFFEWELQQWVQKQLAGKKRKSITLQHGRVGFHKTRGKLEIERQSEAIEWALANAPDAVKITESLYKEPLIDSMNETGEVPPGTKWVKEQEKFYIK